MICLLRRIAFNKKIWKHRSAVYMDKEIVNTARKISFWQIRSAVETFEKKPESTCVFRNALHSNECKTITDEISIFIGASL
jgi:hypothetical protein